MSQQQDSLRDIALKMDELLQRAQFHLADCNPSDLAPLLRACNYAALAAVMFRERADAQGGRGTMAPWSTARAQAEIACILAEPRAATAVLFDTASPIKGAR